MNVNRLFATFQSCFGVVNSTETTLFRVLHDILQFKMQQQGYTQNRLKEFTFYYALFADPNCFLGGLWGTLYNCTRNCYTWLELNIDCLSLMPLMSLKHATLPMLYFSIYVILFTFYFFFSYVSSLSPQVLRWTLWNHTRLSHRGVLRPAGIRLINVRM